MKKLSLFIMLFCAFILGTKAQNTHGNCYRGYVDAGYDFGVGDYEFGRFVINTIHGYQINPYIFLGAGTGLHFMSKYESDSPIPDVRESMVDIPVFANAHVNFLKGKVSPFIDGKAGTFVTNNGGLLWNISAGCRISTIGKQAFNLSIGYAAEKLEFETFGSFISSGSLSYLTKKEILDTECVTLRIGYEF